MKTKSITKSCLEILGLMMIGEGVVCLLHPRRYSLFWKIGPQWLRDTAECFAEHPETTRLVCFGEIAAGLWLALRELNE